jgi:DHA2 family multidrug resistance protein-like MFS transporter
MNDPLIDLRLFRAPAFAVSLGAHFLATFLQFVAFLFVFQYLQLVLGLSALERRCGRSPRLPPSSSARC